MRPSRNYLAWFVCLIIGATILSLVPSTAIAADEDSANDGLLGGALAPLTSTVAPVVDTAEAAVAPVPVVGGAVETVTGAIEPLAPVAGGAVNTVDSTVVPVTDAVPTDIVAGAEAPAAPVEDEGPVCIAIYPPPPGCGPAADASSGANASVNANPAGAADANAAVSTDSTFATDAQAVQAQAVPVAAQAQPVQVISANSGWGTQTDTASQQVITAIGGAQQNPCGNNTASLLFVTQQDFGACADSGYGGYGGVGGGVGAGYGNDTASQQVITAIGGAQQNPCGNNTASLLFVTQQDFGACAENGYGVNNTFAASSGNTVAAAEAQAVPVAVGTGAGYRRTDTASQQVITAIGGAQQNPCGNNTASLLFVTQQDFGACADSGYGGGGGVGGGVGAGYGNDTASQQVITAIGGAQQNPCGNNTASLLFVTQQDFGACAQNNVAANNGVVVSGNAAPVAVSGGSQAPVAQAPNNGGGGIPVVGNLPIVGQVLGGGGGGLPVVGNVLGGGGLPIVGNLPVVGGLL